MKKRTDSINISRREAIKGLAAFGAISLLPKFLFSSFNGAAPIHFFGLGGAGSNQVEFLYNKGIKGKFTCISNPLRPHLSKEIQFINFIPPGKSHYKNGAEVFRTSDMKQAIEMPNLVLNLFNSNDTFVLFSGLGGYTGTFMTEELTTALLHNKKSFITISSVPFEFEGQKRRTLAENTINKLKSIENFHYYELDKIKNEYGNLPLKEALEKANEQMYKIYKANAQV